MNILVSACLLGLPCRYDGRTKENAQVIALSQRHTLIPYCPEVYGGLPTPREPSEIREGRVISRSGADVTEAFEKGAAQALYLAKLLHCECAVLQDRSPSCGFGEIHDGQFGEGLVPGDGFTARLLNESGIRVLRASQAAQLTAACPCPKSCHRHGQCEACRSHHRERRKPPFCKRG